MSLPRFLRRPSRLAGLALVALAGLTCRDRSLTGPGLTAPGKLRIAPSIAAAAPFGPRFTLGDVRVTLTPYPGTGEPMVNEVASFGAGQNELSLDLTVQLAQASQRFVVRIAATDAQAPHDTLFRSVDTVTITAGTDTPRPTPIALFYDGKDKDIASITVEPVDTTFRTTDNVQMRAVAKRADGTVVTDARLGYSVGDETNAQISAGGTISARSPSVGFADLLVMVGSGNGVTGSTRITGRVPVTSVAISLGGASAEPITGTTLQLTGTVQGPNQTPLTGRVVTWGTSNPQRATVSQSGLVTAGPDTGTVTITFASEGVSAELALRVRLVPVAAVRIALPQPLPSFETGDTLALTATAQAANGQPLTGRAVTWTTSTPGNVRVLGDGRVIALAPGAAQVTATVDGVSASVPLTVVRPAVASLVLTPEPLQVTRGSAAATQVSLTDKRGNALTGRTVAYVSTRPAAATVDADGIVLGLVADDTTSVIATSEGKADTVHVTVVRRPVATLTVTPDSSDVIVGGVRPLAASARDAQGNPNGDFPIVWQSLTPNIASVDAEGVVTTLAVGRGVIRVTAGTGIAHAVVQVRPVPVARVAISPRSELFMQSNDTLRLTAGAFDARDNVLEGRVVTWAVVDGPVRVLQDGRVIADVVTAATQAHVSATIEGRSDAVAITVAPQPVASLVLTPAQVDVNRGSTTQLTVALLDRRGNPLGGRPVTFVSTNPTVASVDATGLVAGLVANATANIIATSEGKADTTLVGVLPRPVASVTVAPDSVDVIEGQTVRLAATARDADGQLDADFAITFQSQTPALASVDPASGLVTTLGVGRAVIRATAGGVSADAVVQVRPVPVARVTVSPDGATIFSQDTITLTAIALDANGGTLQGRAFTWAVQDGPVSVLQDGRVIAGVVTQQTVAHVTVSSGGRTATATITVDRQPVATVELTPDQFTVVRGNTQALTTVLRDRRGNRLDDARTVVYVSSRPGVASVDAAGVVTGVAARDTASIIATSETQADTVHVLVSPRPVASVTIAPDSQDVIVGRTGQVTATAFDDRQQPNPDFPIAFQSLNTNFATVNATTGAVTGVAIGHAVIRATAGGVSADAVVQVRPVPVTQVSVDRNFFTMYSRDTVQLTATVLVDGQPQAGRRVNWSWQTGPIRLDPIRNTNSVLVIGGVVDHDIPARLIATDASDGRIFTVVTLTLSPQPVASLVLTPEPLRVARGNTAQLSVALRDRRGDPINGRDGEVQYTSTRPSVAGVSSLGVVQGLVANDTASVIATANGKADTVHVTVDPRPVQSVEATPRPVDVIVGRTVQLDATAYDDQHQANPDFPIRWLSSNPNLATVSATGVVTGLQVGPVVIRAEAGDDASGIAFANVTVNVIPVPVGQVAITPNAAALFSQDTLVLSAAVLDAQQQPIPGRTVTWSVQGPIGAPLARVESITGTTARVIAAFLTIDGGQVRVIATADDGTTTGTAFITVSPQPVASLVLTPEPLSVVNRSTAQLTVALADKRGNPLPTFGQSARSITYTSTRPAVASVNATGVVTGLVANDTSSIIATSEGRADTVHVTVTPRPLGSLTVRPTSANLFIGETVTIVPTALDAQQQPDADFPVTFTSLNPDVATVDRTTGVVTAVAPGQATIRAAASTFTADATITVARRITGVAVTPREVAPIASIGEFVTLTAQAMNGDAPVPGENAFTWASRDPNVVAIESASGTTADLVAVGNGATWVVATLVSNPTLRDSVLITVSQRVAALTISPDTATRFLGTLLQYTASARDARGRPIPAALAAPQLGWSTLSGGRVVSVDGNGLATMRGLGADSVVVVSANGLARAVALVTVRSAIARIFMPADQHVATALGEALTFSAFALDTAGTPMPNVPLAWASSNSAVLRFDSVAVGGVAYFTALSNGQADVTATAQGVEGRTSAIVNQRLAQIRLEPAVGATLSIGGTLAVQGTYFDRNGFPMQAQQQPQWGVRNEVGVPAGTSVASVNQAGVVTALGRGTIDIVATLSNVTSNAVRITVQGLGVVFANDKLQVGTRTTSSVQLLLNGTPSGPVTVYVYPADPKLVQLGGNGGVGDNNGAGILFPRGATAATLTISGIAPGATKLYAVEGVCNDGCRAAPSPTLIPDTADVSVGSAMAIEAPVRVARGDSALTRLILQDPAPKGGLTVDFRYSQVGVVAVRGAGQSSPTDNVVVVPEGLLAADIYVRALFQGATDITPVPRSSTIPGFSQHALVTQGQLFLMSYLDYYTGDTTFVIGEGQTGSYFFETNVAASSAPGDSLRVGLTPADAKVVGTDIATAVIPPGESEAPFRLRGLGRGRTTLTAAALPPAGSGIWLPATRAVHVSTPYINLTSDGTGTAGHPPASPQSPPSTITMTVTDSLGVPHSRLTPLTIGLRSDNAAVAIPDVAQATLQAGDFASAVAHIRFIGGGTANIIAEAPGHRPDTVTVTVATGKLQFAKLDQQTFNYVPVTSATVPIAQSDFSLYVMAPTAATAATPLSFRRLGNSGKPVTSSPASLTLPQNADNVQIDPLTGLALGTDLLEVSAPGYLPDTVSVTVVRGTLVVRGLPDTVQVAQSGNFSVETASGLPMAAQISVTPSPANGASRIFNVNAPNGPAVLPAGQSSAALAYTASGAGTIQVTFTPDNPNYDVLTRTVVVIQRKLVAFVRRQVESRVPTVFTADTVGIGQRTSQFGQSTLGVRTDVSDGATTTIRVRSLDPQVAVVGVNAQTGAANDTIVSICQDCNQTEASFYAYGLSRGTARIEVSDAAPSSGGAFAPDTVLVAVVPGRLTTSSYSNDPVIAFDDSVGVGQTQYLDLYLTDSAAFANVGMGSANFRQREAGASPLAVRLTSSNTNVLRWDSTYVHVPVGASNQYWQTLLRAVGAGTATITIADSATAATPSLARYLPISKTIRVQGDRLALAQHDQTLGMRQRFTGVQGAGFPVSVCRTALSPTALTVRVRSSHPTVADVSTSSLTIAASAPTDQSPRCAGFDVIGQDSIGVVAISVEAMTAQGTVDPNVAPDSMRLTVGRPRFSVYAPSVNGPNMTLTVQPVDQAGNQRYPAEAVPVVFTSDNPSVAQPAQATATFAVGQPLMQIPLTTLGPGQARFTASDGRATAPAGPVDRRYVPGTTPFALRVTLPQLAVAGPGAATRTGVGLEDAGFTVTIPSALTTPTTVSLTTTDPKMATVSPSTVTIPAGSTSGTFTLRSVGGAGSVGITATATGYDPGTLTRALAPGRLALTGTAWPAGMVLSQTANLTLSAMDPDGLGVHNVVAPQALQLTVPSQLEVLPIGATTPVTSLTIPAGSSGVPFTLRAVEPGIASLSAGSASFQTFTSPTTSVAMAWGAIGLGSGSTIAGEVAPGEFACGISASGRNYCWGSNAEGQFGDGSSTSRLVPTKVGAGLLPALDPSMSGEMGTYHSCIITADSLAYCAGRNNNAQLGNGQRTAPVSTPQAVNQLKFTVVSPGDGYTCGIGWVPASGPATRAPFCWGFSAVIQSGGLPALVPTRIKTSGAFNGQPFSYVSSGATSACAQQPSAASLIWCWGDGVYGQLGSNLFTPSDTGRGVVAPPLLPTGQTRVWQTVKVGKEFACAVVSTTATAGFDVYCWGRNEFGQLGVDPARVTTLRCGNPAVPCASTPQQITALTGRVITQLAVGANHACAVEQSGTMWCWGSNASGQLGTGQTGTGGFTPVQVTRPAGFTTIARIDAGVESTCATTTSGTAWCWGRNANGQLGNGGQSNTGTPTRVSDPLQPPPPGSAGAPRLVAGRLQ